MPILNKSSNRFINDKNTRVSVGIDLPVSISPGTDGFFTTTKTTIDSIKADIKMLLMTERGERVFQPALGMNIRKYLFEQITEDVVINIENDIIDTFQRWLPFVQIVGIDVNDNQPNPNMLHINLRFKIKNASADISSVGVLFE